MAAAAAAPRPSLPTNSTGYSRKTDAALTSHRPAAVQHSLKAGSANTVAKKAGAPVKERLRPRG